jgi:hypothetical protein
MFRLSEFAYADNSLTLPLQDRMVIAFEIIGDWLLILTHSASLRVVAIDIPALKLSHPLSFEQRYFYSPLPEGTDLFTDSIMQGLWAGEEYDYVVKIFPAPMELDPEEQKSVRDPEEDTFLLISQNYGFWPMRFHIPATS